jgi:cupin fold WbuC family metalloprotein
MSGTEYIDAALLARLGEAARESPRRRRNHNFHRSDAAPANRLLNAVEPGSYIAPHRHLDPSKDETFVVLRGSFVLVLFDDAGGVTDARVLRAGGETLGATVPAGTFHTLVALESGSVIFEAKAGPYRPLTDEERAPWAPREGDPEAAAYLERLAASVG